MTNHCKKHPNFIPSCKACVKIRDNLPVKKEKLKPGQTYGDVVTDSEMAILNSLRKNIKVLCTRSFESIVIPPKRQAYVHLYHIAMKEHGYTFLYQLIPAYSTTQYIILFEKTG